MSERVELCDICGESFACGDVRVCDICGESVARGDVRVGNGDGRGQRFVHRWCYDAKRTISERVTPEGLRQVADARNRVGRATCSTDLLRAAADAIEDQTDTIGRLLIERDEMKALLRDIRLCGYCQSWKQARVFLARLDQEGEG